MDKMKQWVALTVVGVLAVLAGGWFLVVSPKRTDAADTRAQANKQLATNAGLQTQLEQLKSQVKTLPALQAQLAQVAAKIPDNPALPSLIRALTKAADDAGVELVSLSPNPPTAVAQSAAPAGQPAAQGVTPPAGAAPAAGSAGILQSIGLTLSVAGRYFQIEQFFEHVENITRALKVTGLTLAPGSNPLKTSGQASTDPAVTGELNGAIQASVYMAQGRLAAPAVPSAKIGK